MLIAAIYARKSTDQSGISDEAKSVTRQIEHARAYAARRGWTVSDGHIFADDGISGAEFATRPGFVRLLNSIKPRPEFQVLVMSEESRLGREAIETAYALKQLIQARVRVFFYLEDRERTLDSPADKLMMSVTAFADELEREKARQRTYDAMQRKARAGHVTGGRVFGYDNIEILHPGPDGLPRRSHVERRINEAEAAVVRDIFERFIRGEGLPTIAKALNAAGARSPRAQQGRPNGWTPSSVREVLLRPLYRGDVVWNRTRKRDQWGRKRQRDRPPAEWLVKVAPELRIIDEPAWIAAQARVTARKARYLTANRGARGGRPPASGTKYLLAGLLRCECCGSSLEARTREHGKRRAVFYGCSGYHRRGVTVCGNRLSVPAEALELAVLGAIERRLLTPAVIEAALDQVEMALREPAQATNASELRAELDGLAQAIRRLSDAIAAGGNLSGLLEALRSREERHSEVARRLETLKQTAAKRVTFRPSRSVLRARLDDWKGLLRRQVPEGRELLKQLIVGRLDCRPNIDQGFYEFSGEATFAPVLGGLVPQNVASPAGFEPASPP